MPYATCRRAAGRDRGDAWERSEASSRSSSWYFSGRRSRSWGPSALAPRSVSTKRAVGSSIDPAKMPSRIAGSRSAGERPAPAPAIRSLNAPGCDRTARGRPPAVPEVVAHQTSGDPRFLGDPVERRALRAMFEQEPSVCLQELRPADLGQARASHVVDSLSPCDKEYCPTLGNSSSEGDREMWTTHRGATIGVGLVVAAGSASAVRSPPRSPRRHGHRSAPREPRHAVRQTDRPSTSAPSAPTRTVFA